MSTWQIIVSVCAGILTLCAVGEKVWKYTRPVANAEEELKTLAKDVPLIKAAISEHATRLNKIELHQSNDINALKDHAAFNRVISAAMLALLDHELDGNHTAQLEDAKENLRKYLIER
jgi:hypothetical protein